MFGHFNFWFVVLPLFFVAIIYIAKKNVIAVFGQNKGELVPRITLKYKERLFQILSILFSVVIGVMLRLESFRGMMSLMAREDSFPETKVVLAYVGIVFFSFILYFIFCLIASAVEDFAALNLCRALSCKYGEESASKAFKHYLKAKT